MAKRDFYDILGVSRDADAAELKKSFRQKAMRLHPDRNPDDPKAEHQFKELNAAYDVLRDEQKRAAYDQFGHAAFEGAVAGGGGPGGAGFGFEFGQGFADVFDEMFGDFMGGGRRGGGAASGGGSDLRYNMEITLEDAFKGKKATIRVPTSVICDGCKGSGGAKGSRPVTCGSCQGRGKVRAQQGFFTIERTCPTCGGGGQVIANPCTACGGAGRVRKDKTLSVSIPAGVEEGTRIRLAGEGEAGVRGGKSGDLYIFLNISSHRFFQRDGANIYCRVPIPMTTAALGGTVEVPTVDGGRARVTIPAGTQGADQFRLRGKGMSVLRAKGRGDMFIEVTVETPVNLDRRQKDLLRDLEKSNDKHPTSPEADGFFTKVRDLWEDLKD